MKALMRHVLYLSFLALGLVVVNQGHLSATPTDGLVGDDCWNQTVNYCELTYGQGYICNGFTGECDEQDWCSWQYCDPGSCSYCANGAGGCWGCGGTGCPPGEYCDGGTDCCIPIPR